MKVVWLLAFENTFVSLAQQISSNASVTPHD
jgi:hypothetical protein